MDLTTVSTGVSKRILKKRVGRGIGSGHGKTGTRGHKGQYASAGAEMAGVLFAGGQTPIHRRFLVQSENPRAYWVGLMLALRPSPDAGHLRCTLLARSATFSAGGFFFDYRPWILSSAGIDPQPIAPNTVNFLRDKQHETSRLSPKALTQIPNLDHYHVIVVLAHEAQKAFPLKPRKAVFLDWSVADPSRVTGSPAEVTVAYEATYQFLREHIKDLVEAVLGNEDE